jgi:hypothetical protein
LHDSQSSHPAFAESVAFADIAAAAAAAAACPQDVNIELFEAHILGGQSMTSLGGGVGVMAALPAAHAHKSTAAVSQAVARQRCGRAFLFAQDGMSNTTAGSPQQQPCH